MKDFIKLDFLFIFAPRNEIKMRRKIVFTLFLCMAWASTASAQNTIESIRKAYQDIHQTIAQMKPDGDGVGEMPPAYYNLQVVQNLPGTGPHEENIRMYYGDLEPKEEFDPYPPHYLRFTTVKYNFAAREFYEEYLYDSKGQVMFIYAITPDVGEDMVPYELRLWLDGNRLLRFTAKKAEGINSLDIASVRKASFREVYSGTTIPELYRRETSRCQQRAQKYLTMFKGIDDNTNL